jgi:hypothetical protein
MANVIVTPNMNLPNPVPGVDPGIDYANNIQSSFNQIDQHNHTTNQGVQIPTGGLNINADLTFNGFNATNLRSARFTAQVSPLALAADIGCIYVSGVDLYYNDLAGSPPIQITSGGKVITTNTGISDGSGNSASFSAGVLVVGNVSTAPDNIQAGSILIGNNTAGSNFTKISAATALAASYTITLPSAIASSANSFLVSNASGVLSYVNVDNSTLSVASSVLAVPAGGITTTQIASQTIAQGNLALRATGSTVAAGGFATSPSSGFFSIGSGSGFVTNLSVTITTTGRPVFVGLLGAPGGTASSVNTTGSGEIFFDRGTPLGTPAPGAPLACSQTLPSSSFFYIDPLPTGTYTYQVVATYLSGSALAVTDCILYAYEI